MQKSTFLMPAFVLLMASVFFTSSNLVAMAFSLPDLQSGSSPNLASINLVGENDSSIAPFLATPVQQNSTIPIGNHSISINEVELNSPNGTQWVELYNPTSQSIDLSNYMLKTIKNSTISIPPLTSLTAHGFYIVSIPKQTVSNIADILTLQNSSGVPI